MLSCYEEGFRLNDAMSECSMRSKARIDTLFEDSKSICSSIPGWSIATLDNRLFDLSEMSTEEQNRANGAVQARIEAMFASVEAETGTSRKSAAVVLPVKYMGAAPVGGRVASVRGLQEPLRQLLERVDSSTIADLEISRRGLTFRTSEIIEKTNPFRRIAVWSALRLRSKVTSSGEETHAFLPLVNDEQVQPGRDKHADLFRMMKGLKDAKEYPPIFAVVMRRPGAARLLECHAFACKSEEDAVAAAATLYRALLADLDANRRRPRQSNGLGCVSLASVASSLEPSIFENLTNKTIFPGSSRISPGRISTGKISPGIASGRISGRISPGRISPGRISSGTPGHPVRPPRSKKNSLSSAQSEISIRKLEKSPRKKISEIKAEDILEARSRKLVSPSRTAISSPRITLGSQIEISGSRTNLNSNVENSNVRVGSNSRLVRALRDETNSAYENNRDTRKNNNSSESIFSRNEERNNYRNKYQNGKEFEENKEVVGNEENDKLENEEITRGNELCNLVYNNYEKVPKGIYDHKSKGNYSVIDKNGDIDEIEVRLEDYKKNQNSYEVSGHDYTNCPEICYSVVKREIGRASSDCRGKEDKRSSSRSRENSIYESEKNKRRSREEIYEEHFRDADKIYSIEQENERLRRHCCERSKTRYENSMKLEKGTKQSSEAKTPRGAGRLSRIETMDKPMRIPDKNGFSRTKDEDPSISRVRKRTRAGSEPPSGRTEEVLKNYQESKLKRSQSDLDVDRGDPMTRVELPRRGSFLKPGSTRLPNNINGGTPLGFTELFDEFRNQEGLTSVDDILAAIIDPEGMSFNDLKPLYKEFLFKLAATLTQDELYERSASIMKRRRRPQRRRSTRKPCLLGRAIKRSVSRLKGNGPTEFTSVIFPARKLNDSFDSSSSCDARNNRKRVLASRLSRRRASWRNKKSAMAHTTSEDSDTCRRLMRSSGVGANRSSSGYVSCSECSYDSESCTCVSADKCYCSLSRRVTTHYLGANNPLVCACDTDSCSDSNKCYCARRSSQPTILEQLRQRGIVPSESTLSRAGSPERGKTCKTNRSHASSKSLEFLKIRPSPGRSSSDNLALDYDLFSPGRKHSPACSEKVLVVSARDPQGRLVYVGGAERDKKSFENGVNCNEAHHEALSIKKSAEIAAVFGPGSVRGCRRTSSISSARSSVSLEAGLGYLP